MPWVREMAVGDRRVALLRGINVGRAKRISMGDLRELFVELGYSNVKTLLNSGNIVFTASARNRGEQATRIERAIAERLGVTTRVVVLSAGEVAEALRENPLEAVATDPSRLLFLALRDSAVIAQLKPLLKEKWEPEALALGTCVAYLWCARGIRDSPLWIAVHRAIGDAGTARNRTTMTKLLAVVDEDGASKPSRPVSG